MMTQIPPEMTVADLLGRYPQAAPIFIQNHMACVGCSMSGFETLADAAKTYNLSLEKLLGELKQAISENR